MSLLALSHRLPIRAGRQLTRTTEGYGFREGLRERALFPLRLLYATTTGLPPELHYIEILSGTAAAAHRKSRGGGAVFAETIGYNGSEASEENPRRR